MRILFDQGVPVGVRNALTNRKVRTAYEEGWNTLGNGDLPDAAEAGFDVFLTADAHLPDQQRIQSRKLAIVILTRNSWKLIQKSNPKIVVRSKVRRLVSAP